MAYRRWRSIIWNHNDGLPYYQWGLSYTTTIWKAGGSDKMKTKEISPVKWVIPFEKEE